MVPNPTFYNNGLRWELYWCCERCCRAWNPFRHIRSWESQVHEAAKTLPVEKRKKFVNKLAGKKAKKRGR